jgi:hypothetical protein
MCLGRIIKGRVGQIGGGRVSLLAQRRYSKILVVFLVTGPTGIGDVLLKDGQLVVYSSTSFTPTRRNQEGATCSRV